MNNAIAALTLLIAGKSVPFAVDSGKNLVLSKSCVKADGTYECRAYDMSREVSLAGLGRIEDGADPGAVACARTHGVPVIAHNESGREYGVCLYKDRSLISMGSLHFHAMDNDEKAAEVKKKAKKAK